MMLGTFVFFRTKIIQLFFIMKKLILSLSLLLCGLVAFAQAGDDRLKEVAGKAAKAVDLGWARGGGVGFDFSGLGILNPRAGAGLNRLGIGGLGTYFANKKNDKSFWDNGVSLQLGVARIGGGDLPFQKSIDQLRYQSKAGYSITKDKKWYATGLLVATTTIMKTYEGNFLTSGVERRSLFSQFLSPAQLQFHPGIEWKPDAHFSFLFSPVGLNLIYVGDNNIAARNIHGNEFGKNTRTQLVPALNVNYTNKFFNDRITYTSGLNWTTNYLNNPFKQGALNFWQNNLSFAITKNFSLDLYGEAQNDHNKFIQVDTNNDGQYNIGTVRPITADGQIPVTEGPDRLGRGTQFIGNFLLKYNKIF
jgi:hypothetical protein